jgi:hypothetical protein
MITLSELTGVTGVVMKNLDAARKLFRSTIV